MLPQTSQNATPERTISTEILFSFVVYRTMSNMPIPLNPDYRTINHSPVAADEEFLSIDDEHCLAKWVQTMQATGFYLTQRRVYNSAELMIKNRNKVHRFRKKGIRLAWYKEFVKRHPETKLKNGPHNSDPIESKVSDWLLMVKNYICDHHRRADDVLLNPNRIFSMNELAFALQLQPGPGVVVEKKCAYAYHLRNSDCDEVAVMIGGNAVGLIAPPMVLFDRMRLPKIENEYNVPASWTIGGSETGWMTASQLYQYIVDIFHPWLLNRRIPLPVVLFLDGLATHVTHVLSEFCERGKIILIGLPATESNAIQPMDLSLLGPLLFVWRDILTALPNQTLSKENFCPILADVIDKNIGAELFEYGFKVCGIYPFENIEMAATNTLANANANTESVQQKRKRKQKTAILQHCLSFLEETMSAEQPHYAQSPDVWMGRADYRPLFELWKEIKMDCDEKPLVVIENNEEKLVTGAAKSRANADDEKTDISQFCLSQLEIQIGSKLPSFINSSAIWTGPAEDESLFKLWSEMKNDMERAKFRKPSKKTQKNDPPDYFCKIYL